MKITVTHKGDFRKTVQFLRSVSKLNQLALLERYGAEGQRALESATPVDSGKTRSSWRYEVRRTRKGYSLSWFNNNTVGDVPLIILLQYGHGTRGGTFVQGRDIVNPAIGPILDTIAENIWKEVTRL